MVKQEENFKGLYGAMNQGFKTIKDNELVLFWGSDDWAISQSAFEDVISKVNTYKKKYDLLICKGRYIDFKSQRKTRNANFFENKYTHGDLKIESRFRNVLKIRPPLVFQKEHADSLYEVLEETLDEFHN